MYCYPGDTDGSVVFQCSRISYFGVWPAEGEATPAAPASQPTTTEAEANMPTALAAVPTAPAAAAGPGAGAATSCQSEMEKIRALSK
jgi:hypothetical protein